MRRVWRVGVLSLGALLVSLVLADGAGALQQKLTPPDTNDAQYGRSVAVDGDTLAVGWPGGKGAVVVYKRFGDEWAFSARLTASDGAPGDALGKSVAIDGDTIVAGAPTDSSGALTDAGSVYTFAASGAAARTETAKLELSTPAVAAFNELGTSVAIDGDTIVAGVPGRSSDAGIAVTFARTGAPSRTETGSLLSSVGATNDHLGQSVAIEGDTIVVGAPQTVSGPNTDQGSVYTFATTGSAIRTQTAKLDASDGGSGDFLGASVAISGPTIVAGAEGADIGASSNQGAAYTFARTGAAARTQTAKLTASDGLGGDSLGSAVATNGVAILAGARMDDIGAASSGINQGSGYTFAGTGPATRNETGHLVAADPTGADQLGFSAALSGTTSVLGAPGDEAGLGGASVFYDPAPAPPDTAPPETSFTKKPRNKLRKGTAKYKFSSSEPSSTFICKLDGQKHFKPCSSPDKLSHLQPGKHKFRVAAVDGWGNVDPTPAKDGFRFKAPSH